MAITFRVKCPGCGQVLNLYGDQACPKCNTQVRHLNQGAIQLYRMGSPIGVAAGFGIYINGVPMGHIGNKESLCLPLPYGTYQVHFTCGMNRKGQDATVTLSPESPMAYVKASIKMGFWSNKMIATACTKEEMPPLA